MAEECWLSALPQVLDLLLNKADRIVDDTSTEKLLVWIADVCRTPNGLVTFLKQDTGVLNFLLSLNESSSSIGIAFAFRLCGILWSEGYTFEHSTSFINLFLKSRENESLWKEAAVRNGYFTGLQSLTMSNKGKQWLQTHKGCLLTAVGYISDSSMFVALAARQLIAKFLIASWSNSNAQNQQDKTTNLSEIEWLVESLKEKLHNGRYSQPINDSQQQSIITKNTVAILDIVRVLLSTSIEDGQEILSASKLFSNCVKVAESADNSVCIKLVDVISGINSRLECAIDWDKMLPCERVDPLEDKQRHSASHTLLKIPLNLYKRGMVPLALNLIAGLSFPNNKIPRCLPSVWPEALSYLINAPIAALMDQENHIQNNMNGLIEEDDSEIDVLAIELLSLKTDDFKKIEKVKKQIQKVLEPWILSRNHQIDALIQSLCTIKQLVTKDTSSNYIQVSQWIEFGLTILSNCAMVTNEDQKPFALDVKGNVKVIKATLSVVVVLLNHQLLESNFTDSVRNLFFHVVRTAIIVARSSQTDATVVTSTLESLGVLLEQGSFLVASSSTYFKEPYHQRTMEDLGFLIHLRLRDQRWEVKDSTLEFVTRLIKTGIDNVIQASILSLVWESVDESESYVRSSAWYSIGHLVCNSGMWIKLKEKERLSELDVLKKIVYVLENDSEAFPRRSVIDCLIIWSREHHPIVSAILPKPVKSTEIFESALFSGTGSELSIDTDIEARSIFSDIVKLAYNDFDWEVKLRVLELVETVIKDFSYSRDHVQKNESSNAERCSSHQYPSQTAILQGDNTYTTNNLITLLLDIGAVLPLMKAMIDCDHLVCEKALKVVSTLKDLVDTTLRHSHPCSPDTDSRLESLDPPMRKENPGSGFDENSKYGKTKEYNQLIQTEEQLQDIIESLEVLSVERFVKILCGLDVCSLTAQCTAADVNVQTDPAGFLEDILAASRSHGENLLDCY